MDICSSLLDLSSKYNVSFSTVLINALKVDGDSVCNLSGISITDPQAAVLAEFFSAQTSSPVRHLLLNDCLLSAESLQALCLGLALNTGVTRLELRGNNVRAHSVAHVANLVQRNRCVQQLILEWNCFGACSMLFQQFCHALSHNHCLRFVDLRNNQLDHECTQHLALALTKNRSLRRLDLRWNSIGVNGARHLLTVLKENRVEILELLLEGNSIPVDMIQSLNKCLKTSQPHLESHDSLSNECCFSSHLNSSTLIDKSNCNPNNIRINQQEIDAQINSEASHKVSPQSERQKYIDHVCQLEAELRHRSDEITRLCDCTAAMRANIEQLEQQLKQKGCQITEELKCQTERHTTVLHSLEQDHCKQRESIKQNMESVISALQEKLSKTELDRKSSELSVVEMEAKLDKMQQERSITEKRCQLEKETIKSRMDTELCEMRLHMEALQTRYCDLEAANGSLTARIVELEANETKFASKYDTLRTEADEWRSRLADMESRARTEAQTLMSEIDVLSKHNDELKRINSRISGEMNRMQTQLDDEISLRREQTAALQRCVHSKERELLEARQQELHRAGALHTAFKQYLKAPLARATRQSINDEDCVTFADLSDH